MPLVDITNPDIIKFLVESYEKTTRLRLKWNNLNTEKLKQAATLTREEKGYYESDVLEGIISACMPTITRDHVVAGYYRKRTAIRDGIHIPGTSNLRKGHSLTDVGLGDPKEDPRLARPNNDLTIDPIMRPINANQREIIYKDLPTYGRKAYLKSRSHIVPEKKYYFRESSGWQCGWRLEDSYFKRNAPKCGRVWSLTRDVRSRTGPHPDPTHYKEADMPGPTKCSKV